jgi:RNA polymerase sigma-70 factor, ECF subfamily
MQEQHKLIDHKIIEECRNGNLSNFRKLIEITSPLAFSLAFRILADEELARDVVQDTMITIWQKLNGLRSADVYKTWMYRIVVNKCNDHLRQKKRNPELRLDESAWNRLSEKIGNNPSSTLENREMSEIIRLLTNRLTPAQKTVFVLSEIEEMTSDEIAGITGLKKSVIKANLYHARKSISGMIEKYI